MGEIYIAVVFRAIGFRLMGLKYTAVVYRAVTVGLMG
jgi:hypothetical protein